MAKLSTKLDQFIVNMRAMLASLFGDEGVKREIKTADTWDGAASNYPDTESYCSACLIDVNPDGETKTQALCKLPVRGPGDGAGVYVDKAVYAAAGGNGIQAVEKPTDVDQEVWDSAVKNAAAEIVSAYGEMGETAPMAVYEIAGMEMPEEEACKPKRKPEMEEERAVNIGNVYDQVYALLQSSNESMEEGGEMGSEHAWMYLHDIYFDDGGMFAITNGAGKMYKCPLAITDGIVSLGAPEEVKHEFTPVRQRSNITRQADGRYRWFGVSCTSVLNRSGEFDTRALFDALTENFEKQVERGETVIRQFFHSGEQFRTGVVDFVARDGNTLITSGLYDDTPLAAAEIKSRTDNPGYWGDSIGYSIASEDDFEILTNADGVQIAAYKNGVLREVSTLPEQLAAAHFTAQEVRQERTMLEGKRWEAFVKLWGGDEEAARAWLENNPDATNRAIASAGLMTRQTEPEAPQAESAPAEIVIDDLVIERVANAVIGSPEIAGIKASVDSIVSKSQELATRNGQLIAALEAENAKLAARLEALERTDEDKKRDWISDLPARSANRIVYRPTESKQEAQPVERENRGQTALDRLPKYHS